MGNIRNNNRFGFDVRLSSDEYWDFFLVCGEVSGVKESEPQFPCPAADFDFTNPQVFIFDSVQSLCQWHDAVNNNPIFENIGFTGVDNGLIKYEKSWITNRQFLRIYFETTYEPEGLKFCMKEVSGNLELFDYPIQITDDGIQLDGGFYQGCFKAGDDYQVLPYDLSDEWVFEFELRPEDRLNNETYILNDKHPENSGMFFYIGTRAENKWWKEMGVEDSGFGRREVENISVNDGYYQYLNLSETDTEYFDDAYFHEDDYFNDEYLEQDAIIDENKVIVTKDGKSVAQKDDTIEIKTDNKFLFFDRTRNGITADKWNENTDVVISMKSKPKLPNLFTLMHRGKDGYTTETLKKYMDTITEPYDLHADLFRNAFGLQIRGDGSIGFKYTVKDCDNPDSYKVTEGFSRPDLVKKNEWSKIEVRMKRNPKIKNMFSKCNMSSTKDTMTVLIKVNGKLAYRSEELPIIRLRNLDDLYSKQEFVPYNISLGGGTQGLAETIGLNYRTPSEYVLPLEKEYGGTFIGTIKTFKIFGC